MGRSASYRSSLPKHRLALTGPSFLPEFLASAVLRLLSACTVTSVAAPTNPTTPMIAAEPRQNRQGGPVVGTWVYGATSNCTVIECVLDPFVAFTCIREGPGAVVAEKP